MDAGPSYAPRVELGEVMVGRSVCEVIVSNVSDFRPRDIVLATSGWQEYSLANVDGVQKIDRSARSLTRLECLACRASPHTRVS